MGAYFHNCVVMYGCIIVKCIHNNSYYVCTCVHFASIFYETEIKILNNKREGPGAKNENNYTQQ